MKHILLLLGLLLVALSCSNSSSNGTPDSSAASGSPSVASPATNEGAEEARLCCNGACDAPPGYCCNEGHCGGLCPEEYPVWHGEEVQ